MISTKRIARLLKKWQRMAAEVDECCTSVASKGHCVVYTADGKRFAVPLAFAELPRMSQEEFGFTSDGRITLPCDVAVMDKANEAYAMCLLNRSAYVEIEKQVFGLFAGWFLGWFGLAGAGLL
ncbi:auxin-responsive protein SAUR36-like [Miscanthus floridulus]|uniref:auxin-responsive protein SAUR36-like n=1 Tax=Miscanthus floridulus TaxID=154761 RepID=UPI003459FA1B